MAEVTISLQELPILRHDKLDGLEHAVGCRPLAWVPLSAVVPCVALRGATCCNRGYIYSGAASPSLHTMLEPGLLTRTILFAEHEMFHAVCVKSLAGTR